MTKFLWKVAERVVCAGLALLLMQFPLFLESYSHALRGHVEELSWQVEHLNEIAASSGKNLDQYIAKFEKQGDPDFAAQGAMMNKVYSRYERLKEALHRLGEASSWSRPWVFATTLDGAIFISTLRHFTWGLSFTRETLLYGVVGLLIGIGLCACLQFQQKKRA